MPSYTATHRFARISVRKLRPILDLIRGKYADDAVDILKYMPHRGARMIEQVLKSAMANAEDKGVRNVGDLIIVEIRGDGGPMFKRLMPRARGMAYMIRRRSSHINIASGRPGNLPVARRDGGRRGSGHRINPKDAPDGPEDQSDRLPRRHHGGLAEPLVRLEARVHRPPGRGLQDPQVHQGEVQLRRHPQDRDRADPRRRHGPPVHRAAGHDHRPQGGRGREAPGGAPDAHRPSDRDQDRRKSPGPRSRPS